METPSVCVYVCVWIMMTRGVRALYVIIAEYERRDADRLKSVRRAKNYTNVFYI